MRVGFIGAGNMARALARGLGEPVLCTDSGSGRAQQLAQELGGEAVPTNRELAEAADLVILAHKPVQLDAVAGEIAGTAKAVVSLLARTSQADVARAYPGTPVIRAEPNLPVELRRGVTSIAEPEGEVDEAVLNAVYELFGRVGAVVTLPERLMTVAGACSGVGPAYWALLVEAQVDAAVRRGIPAAEATKLVLGAMHGTAELLQAREGDTLALRREVTSPGGTTARGLAALERGGVRAAFHAALDAVVDG
jgi:pyrroline-5-carboxylate reductase